MWLVTTTLDIIALDLMRHKIFKSRDGIEFLFPWPFRDMNTQTSVSPSDKWRKAFCSASLQLSLETQLQTWMRRCKEVQVLILS